MLELITAKECFGKCVGKVAVIEFQKHGAPHCHLLVWIKDSVNTPANIDNIICAEIPPEGNPLRNRVIKSVIQGPCGRNINMNLGCVKNSSNDKYKHGFPKAFSSVTSIGNSGSFPEYHRKSHEEDGYTQEK